MRKPTTKQNALGSRSPTSFRSASRRSDAPRPPGRRVARAARPGNDAPPRSALPGLAPLPRFLNRKRPAAKLSQTTPSCALCKWQGWRHAPAHLQWRERQPGAQRGGRGPDPTAAESRREGRLGDGSLSCENKAVITEGPASHRDNRVGTGRRSDARASSPGRGSSWTYTVIRAAEAARMAANASTVTPCRAVPRAPHDPLVAGEAPEAGEAGWLMTNAQGRAGRRPQQAGSESAAADGLAEGQRAEPGEVRATATARGEPTRRAARKGNQRADRERHSQGPRGQKRWRCHLVQTRERAGTETVRGSLNSRAFQSQQRAQCPHGQRTPSARQGTRNECKGSMGRGDGRAPGRTGLRRRSAPRGLCSPRALPPAPSGVLALAGPPSRSSRDAEQHRIPTRSHHHPFN